MMDDSEIVKDCIEKNPRGQQLLFEIYAPKMMTVSLRYMKNLNEAEDVLQDAFIKIFNKIEDFNNQGSLQGWIHRVVVNSCLDQLRKNKKFLYDVNLQDAEHLKHSNAHIAEGLMAEDLMKLVQKLPDGYKVVFNLFAIEGYGHKEIADMLGISENTSKSQYLRAREYLRKELEKMNYVRE